MNDSSFCLLFNGFRPNQATTDVLRTVRIISELAIEVADPTDPVAIVSFDIQRAYPSIPRDAPHTVFHRCFGLPSSLIQVIQSLHNHTSFVIRTRQGDSVPFHAEKGFREGCPSSPGWHVEHRVLSKNPFAGHPGSGRMIYDRD